MNKNTVRQNLMKMCESGMLARYDTGIYYFPIKTPFGMQSTLSRDEVIKKKYLVDKGEVCGYLSGQMLANQIGITTQIPAVYEIMTNKATTDCRETTLGKSKIVVKKPRTLVCNSNAAVLQYLDAVLDAKKYSEYDIKTTGQILRKYAQTAGITFKEAGVFLQYYPDRIYKAMYEMEMLTNAYS